MRSVSQRSFVLPAIALALYACDAGPGERVAPWLPASLAPQAGAAETAGQGASDAADEPGPSGTPSPACASYRLTARVIALTPRQYVNVLRDVIGPTAVSDDDAAANSDLEFDTLDLSPITTATFSRFERLSDGAIESLRGNTADFLHCHTTAEDDCVRAALLDLAHRTYNRPVGSQEIDALMALRAAGQAAIPDDGGESGTLAALQAVLLAPSTLYRTEFQAGFAPGGFRSLTARELAGALGAFLLDSVPDQALLAAADDGSLLSRAGLETQVDRLLALPRVREHITQLVLAAFDVPKILSTSKDVALFPNYDASLRRSMYEETRRLVDDVLWTRGAPLGELLTTRQSFASGALAQNVYALDPAGEGNSGSVTLGAERAGILTQASVLSVLSRTDVTSVVARGLFVRNKLLCLPAVPAPPASVLAQVAAQLSENATQSELATYRANTMPCMGCHRQFDPFGLLLEDFDPIGRHIFAPQHTADLAELTPLSGTVSDAAGLVAKVEQAQLFEHCLANRTLSYALSTSADSQQLCLTDGVEAIPASGSIRDLVLAIASSPAFNTRAGGTEP